MTYDAYDYFDHHINTYNNKIYPGNIIEKIEPHKENLDINYKITDMGYFQCVHCNMSFRGKRFIYRHLGYNNVNMNKVKCIETDKIEDLSNDFSKILKVSSNGKSNSKIMKKKYNKYNKKLKKISFEDDINDKMNDLKIS